MGNDRFQLVGTCLEGKFRVERFVAEGGFAVVYSGQHLSLDRAIAIKVLKTPPELNEQARQQFISKFNLEAKTIARLSHLNIVQVIDFGVSQMPSGISAPWMVLEWLTGRSLEQDLQTRRGLEGRSPQEALELLEPIFDALAYAHEEGIAHRDVKPANIMVVATKRGEMLKLLDFGIVKIMDKGEIADRNLAPTRGVLSAHSPAYAAPEQITGLRTGPWTDVHALALIITEVMTNLPPYDGKNITTLLREILSPQRPTPARHRIDAGPWEAVLGKGLALEPSDRFKDASEFLMALKSAIPATLKPVALAQEPEEKDYVRTQLLGPSPAPAKSQPLAPLQAAGAPATSVTPKPLKVPAAKGPGRPRPSEGSDSAFKSSRLQRAWLAAAVGLVALVLGGGYLALRKGDETRVKTQSGLTPEARRGAPAPALGSGDTSARREPTDNPAKSPEAPQIPSSTAQATKDPSPEMEASRNHDAKMTQPAVPPVLVGTTTSPDASSAGRDRGFVDRSGQKAAQEQPGATRRRPVLGNKATPRKKEVKLE